MFQGQTIIVTGGGSGGVGVLAAVEGAGCGAEEAGSAGAAAAGAETGTAGGDLGGWNAGVWDPALDWMGGGVVLERGTYKFVFRVLRVGGNRDRNDNWQTVISAPFTLIPRT